LNATADLFLNRGTAQGVVRRTLEGGCALYEAGDPARAVYFLRSGLLAVMRDGGGRQATIVGYVRAGECVGEMAVLAGTTRSATVVALRDCVIDAIPAKKFHAALTAAPHVAVELLHLVARRARDMIGSFSVSPHAQTVLIAGIGPGTQALSLAHDIARAGIAADQRIAVLEREAVLADPSVIERAGDSGTLVLLAAEHDEPDWAAHCRRQVDRVLLLGRSDQRPPADCALCTTEPLQAHQLVDLVLSRAPNRVPNAGHEWLGATHAAHLFHVDDEGSGIARLARILTGTSIGLVLSGGGARAFAHIGAVRALREAGVMIDLIGGTSMGAIVAAGVASGWDDAELDERMRAAFVESSPLDDIALPIVAMTRGRKVEMRLREHFGDVDIADLDMPFFCVSADLTSGHHHAHDRGSLVTALRASISLPGVLPPVIVDDHVLVDGGVLRNLPTDVMRARHEGTVIGCDVTRSAGLASADVMPPASWCRWFASGAWRRGPPIVSILMRSGTVGTSAEIAAARAACDLYVMPDTGMVEIRDWRAYPQAVEAGYRAMRSSLATLDMPVNDPRNRRMAHPR
jgi:NTE family protein